MLHQVLYNLSNENFRFFFKQLVEITTQLIWLPFFGLLLTSTHQLSTI